MDVHVVDGTYELFRHFFAVPSHVAADGQEVGAVRGVLGSIAAMLEDGATHIGVATDHVIESFRNDLWPGYKDGSDIDPLIKSQFQLLEDGLVAMGLIVWPMVAYEADDAMAAAAFMAAADERVDRVFVCTPDKDLGQVVGGKIVQFDRRKGVIFDRAGVIAKFGVPPEAIPDYLGLVGDSADGFPGLAGWGAKSSATLLARYGHIEDIPLDSGRWDVAVRGAVKLAARLAEDLELALLFRRIATLETDAPIAESVDDLRWVGPKPGFESMCERIEAPRLVERIDRLVP